MKTYSRQYSDPSYDTYASGQTVRGQSGSCSVYESLIVPSSGQLHGDFKTPNPWSFKKVNSTGFRSHAVLTSPDQATPGQFISCSGGHRSILDSTDMITAWGTPTWSNAINQAAGALSSKVRGDLDLSIDLFQWKQTAKLVDRIWNLSRTLERSWRNVKRRQGPVKEIANLYLEWTFGLAPTLDTLFGLVKKINSDGLSGEGLIHCRGRGKTTDLFVGTSSSVVYVNGPYYSFSAPILYNQTSEYRCQYDIYLKPELSQWQKIGEYATLNPVSWIYESVPFSFVLDYFWNFSRFLRSMETAMLHSARFHSGTVTYTLLQRTTPVTSQLLSPDGLVKLAGTSGSHTFKGLDRYVLSSFPVPSLPSFDIQMGARRMVNVAALLSQMLPDMFKPVRNRKTWPLLRPLSKTPRYLF